MNDLVQVVDPVREARERVGGRFDVRVLEPSPNVVIVAPWSADDPVNESDGSGLPVLAPVPLRGAASTWDELALEDPDLARWCGDRWLGAWRRLVVPADLDALTRTRESWHTLAEHVLAAARYRANGKIGLRFTRAGFGTPFFGSHEQLRVAGGRLLVIRDGGITADPVTTVAAAARAARIAPGAPSAVYRPTTPLDPDAVLEVDDASAQLLGDWFGNGASVLEELRAVATAADAPARVQLWPEHFDLSVDLGDEESGSRATFGVSPGDAGHPLPYVYVTPWKELSGDFWNERTFASASITELAGAADQRRATLDFFRRARVVLGS